MTPTSHGDLVLLTSWLADRGYDAKSIAHAVEKPHKYEAEFALASAVRDHLRDNLGHFYLMHSDVAVYCDGIGGATNCPWTARWDERTSSVKSWEGDEADG